MTFDDFAKMANLKLAQMYFPAKTGDESMEMLRICTEILLESGDSPAVDEQQNCAECPNNDG